MNADDTAVIADMGDDVRYMNYPFQVRPGMFAFLKLPIDLTADDIARLCAFIQTLERP